MTDLNQGNYIVTDFCLKPGERKEVIFPDRRINVVSVTSSCCKERPEEGIRFEIIDSSYENICTSDNLQFKGCHVADFHVLGCIHYFLIINEGSQSIKVVASSFEDDCCK